MTHAAVHAHSEGHFEGRDFFPLFVANLKKELLLVYAAFAIALSFLFGFLLFIFEFDYVSKAKAFILPPLIVFVLAKYVALFSVPTIVVLLLVPKKISLPIVLIASLFSIFSSFLI